jgi:hypothetical protein
VGLEILGNLKLEMPVVDPGQVDPFLEHLLPDRFRSVDGGEDAVELLALVAGEEIMEATSSFNS